MAGTVIVARPAPSRRAHARGQLIAVAHMRLMVVMLLFAAAMTLIVGRLAALALFAGGEARSTVASLAARGDIVDRNGQPLARTIDAWTIAVHPRDIMGDKLAIAARLAALMPDRGDQSWFYGQLTKDVTFTYLQRRASPALVEQVNALGEPAIVFARETQRLYPQSSMASHALGYLSPTGHGMGGMERVLDQRLLDARTNGTPVQLSLDTRVQAAMESELGRAMTTTSARAASGVVLDVNTGEVIAMVSLPTFNPNRVGMSGVDQLRNITTQNVYELGSTFKPITAAAAIDNGVVTDMSRRFDATAPMKVAGFTIHDDRGDEQFRWLNIPETLIYSSNIATARIADEVGAARMEAMFRRLGFDQRPAIELKERAGPLWPRSWGRLGTMTMAYGHGIAVTPLHLASAYAALVNGGVFHPATMMRVAPGQTVPGRRVIKETTSARIRQLLRLIVMLGTGRKGDAPGYRVGGKTGTAEAASGGGYDRNRNVATFAAAFPMDAPRYVVLAMLDSPQGTKETFGLKTAAWTAAPVVGRVIARTGAILGVTPDMSRDIDVSDLTPLIWQGPRARACRERARMKLGALTGGSEETTVTGFAIDHRKVAPGTVFGAFPGMRVNGEDFIADAVRAGAVAVVARPSAHVEGAVHLVAEEPRQAFAQLAARFFAPFPATCVAVTGTNGKTSTVEMTRQLWRMAGHHAASIGTLGVTTADERVTTGLTTPDVVTFLANVAGLAREGVTHVAFEASSHGLHQYRTEGLPVAAAAFTNLGRDHLDYHGDMGAYLTAKMRLFSEVLDADGTAVVWADDPEAPRVIDLARERGNRLVTVGTRGCTLRLKESDPTLLGQGLIIETKGGTHRVRLPLIGDYQAANALVAAGLVIATGGHIGETLANLARLQPVRGRLERAAIARSGAPVYVDYAHTPDAIEAAALALKPHAKGRLILVLGAGGDRDEGKRPAMGQVAAARADRVIVTDDNPRSEDPAAIRAAVLKGAPGASEIGDRREAIAAAIAAAGPDDIVLIAGKGHEQGQLVGDLVLPFDDVAVARECAG